MDFLKALTHLGFADVLDIVVVAVVLYGLVRGIRRSRSGFVLTGVIMVSSLYVVARLLGLNLVTFFFQAFFTVILVTLIVIFQDDLRLMFERVALRGLRRKRGADDVPDPGHGLVEILVRTLSDLARERVGVILVLQGRDPVFRHVQGGVPLDAKPSEALIKSLFDPHSIGHDGAVVLSGNRLARFSCHLPLSTDDEQLRGRGTRHAAALGLAERTDALCLAVSEERGTISVARHGKLETLRDAADLTRTLEEFLVSMSPPRGKRGWIDLARRDPLERATALMVAVALWFFLVHESEIVYRSFEVQPAEAGLAAGLEVASIRPGSVEVILSGPRRSFYFVGPEDVGLTTKLFRAGAGEHVVHLSAPDTSFPQGLTFVNIIPRELRVEVVAAPQRQEEEHPPK